jgi:hypothetical protein
MFRFFILFLISHSLIYAQSTCFCKDTLDLPDEFLIQYCKPLKLKTGEYLYYEYNCDSLWLTMESIHTKLTLFKKDRAYYQNSYEKPYLLITEFSKYLLFAQYCNPHCTHYLIDKATGKITEEFAMLIFDGNLHDGTNTNLMISFTNDSYNQLQIFDITSGKKNYISVKPMNNNLIYPEDAFISKLHHLKNDYLYLAYATSHKKRHKPHFLKIKIK